MKVYLVGGAVRDKLMGSEPTDLDYVVTGAVPADMLARGMKQVGADFPVFLDDNGHQYALARSERKTGPGYRGFETSFDPSVPLYLDLARRDLTINAIAMDEDGNLFDPFHGAADIKNKVLRHVGPAFAEDPLRVLRVARFMARYGGGYINDWRVAPETMALMRMITESGELNHLTPERVWAETEKALGECWPEQYFLTLKECGALNLLFPGLPMLTGAQALIRASTQNWGILPRFCALTHRMETGALESLCARLKVQASYRDTAVAVARNYPAARAILTATPAQVLELLEDMDAFRRPQRTNYLILLLPDAEGDYLHRALLAATHARVPEIGMVGQSGSAIGGMVRRARLSALQNVHAPERAV